MYLISSTSTSGETKNFLHGFKGAKKYYNDFCAFMGIKNPTEIEEGTILAWSDKGDLKITFEKLSEREFNQIS